MDTQKVHMCVCVFRERVLVLTVLQTSKRVCVFARVNAEFRSRKACTNQSASLAGAGERTFNIKVNLPTADGADSPSAERESCKLDGSPPFPTLQRIHEHVRI